MYYLKKYKLILLLPLLIIMIIMFFNKDKDDSIILEEENILEKVEVEIKSTLKIDVKGAVNNPGVYELEEGTRVSDAILVSGGLTENADTSIINLSKNLKDEMVIIIYTKEEISEMRKGSTTVKYIEKECICPSIENDACIEDTVTNNEEEATSKISLNNATLKELMTLTGIGESKAKLIIEYREKNGGFKSIEELKNVKGIGDSTYEKIKNFITT